MVTYRIVIFRVLSDSFVVLLTPLLYQKITGILLDLVKFYNIRVLFSDKSIKLIARKF